ncbi:hypothetical protein MAPG_10846 [Magnaporthiopsis poae ATCC 64411]|uniref:Uncharacterized protein n=1 Tax=Magnaporthiopsis poae (strain ATCC 64411 / 73-15) TaxID=644358 RepID=A0A0C4EDP0_MAGP6|nr:hypothetical protein MAPG_10846 [Magnaporthiopsis poae ATCC 64411]
MAPAQEANTPPEWSDEALIAAEDARVKEERRRSASWRERIEREFRAIMAMKRIPFTTDEPMSGPAPYSWADLKKPLLRKCPFELKDIRWLKHLGGGMDGYCWKVAFGDQGPFVVKMFWDHEPEENMNPWSAQRECQNAAVLQMIEASLGDLGDGDGQTSSIRVFTEPINGDEAIENLYAFSQEARKKPRIQVDPEITHTLDSMIKTRKCFGWMKLSGAYFAARRGVRPPSLRIGKYRRGPTETGLEYFAIVYEYIEPQQGDDDPKCVDLEGIQASMDFLWTVGFEFSDTRILDNWKGGVLIDLSDIVFPLGCGTSSRHDRGCAKSLQKAGKIFGNPY